MKTMVRCRSLDMAALAAQEAHGKREDRTSQKRIVRDVAPLVAGGLDLRDLYDAHMDGVKQNAGAKKPVLHFLVRFPPELLDQDASRFSGSRRDRQAMMLRQAVAFINQTHGGQAVFAARIDRDEAGETVVDVFASPRYEKRTKRTKADEKGATWASATKFGKELAEKHQPEIQRRHPNAKGKILGPRAVGIALNSEWRDWFEQVNQIDLAKKNEKVDAAPDRLETEAFKQVQDARDEIERDRAALDRVKSRVVRLVAAFGATFGLPLPKRLGDAVAALEGELAGRVHVSDPMQAESGPVIQADDPFTFDPS